MVKKSKLWIMVILILMSGLLWFNYSNRIEYVKLKNYSVVEVTPSATITCANFSTQKEAQDFSNTHKQGLNLSGLDGDHDGQVCESLP